ncbi:AAA family ATPase, partial [Colletotrichum sojae]
MLGAAPWPPESQDDSDSDDKSLENKKRDIVLLRCFIDMSEKFLKPLLTLQSSISDGTLEKISFADLWFLYQPSDIVFGREPTSDHKQHGPSYSDLKLYCYSWRYNGTRFMPSTTTKTIPMFDGEKSIKDLPYFPKQLCESDDPVVSELVARGNRFQR